MAIQKNFVIKNGLEISTDLIIADANTRKVGIGTTVPQYLLHVNGGIGVTDAYVSGIATFANQLRVGTEGTVLTVLGLGNSIGVGTANPAFLLDIRSPVSTGQTALFVQGDVRVTGDLSVDDITLDDAEIQDLIVTNTLFVSGVSTFTSNVFVNAALNVSGITTLDGYVDINNSVDVSGALNVSGITTLDGYVDINNSVDVSGALNVVGLSTLGGYVDINNSIDVSGALNVVGLSTLGGYVDINNSVDISNNLNVTGIATIAMISVVGAALSSLIVSGIATLGNVNISNDLNVIGLTTLGGYVDINNSVDISNNLNVTGIATITNITGPDGTITNIYSTNAYLTNIFGTDLSLTGISTLGTVRVSSGIITATSGIVTYFGDGSYLTGTASNPTLQAVLNIGNTSTIGMSISGVITATAFIGDGSGLTGVGIGSTGSINTSGIITATAFIGDGSGLTGAGSTVVDDTTTNQTFYPIFTQTTSGTITASKVSTTKLNFNPSTGALTATDINSTSDIKLKENIKTVDNALETISALRGVSFDWKETGKGSYGVIAQELQEILPELVSNGEIKSVNYNGLIGVLIEAVKELKEKVQGLENAK